MASVLTEFGRTLKEGGEPLFEAHPAPSSLRDVARGSPGVPQTARHVETCVSCALEVEAWKRMESVRPSVPLTAASPSRKWAFALAAGVVLGFALGALA